MNTSASSSAKAFPKLSISIRVKMLLIFTLLFTVVLAGTFYWFYQFSTRLALDNLASEMTAIAQSAAKGIDGDQHQALYQSDALAGAPLTVKDDRYWKIVSWLALTQRVLGKTKLLDGTEDYRIRLYTYVATDTPGKVMFVGSSASSIYLSPDGTIDPNTSATFNGANFREAYQPQSQEMLNGLMYTTVNITHPITDKWGRWYSAFTPIYNKQGTIVGALGIDVNDTTVSTLEQRIKSAMIFEFLITYAVLFVAVFAISYGISRPIARLTKSVARVADGDYSEEDIPETNGLIQDETTVLANVFRQMVIKVAAREQRLKQQVQELKIEIDHSKQDKQVAEIVDTDYFRDLQSKARLLRARAALEQATTDET